jgi:tetratricopeptide (TPR) repeat protein
MISDVNNRWQTAAIFTVALLLRLLHVWQLDSSPFSDVLLGDARGYDEWAVRLAAGDWIGTDVFYQAPLYPYFLGVLYATFGRDLLVVRLVQAGIGSTACVLLGIAGTRVFSPRAGLIAGMGLALYAPAIFLDALIQKSTLDVFFVCLVLCAAAGLLAEPRRLSRWAAMGAALGALCLTRENALVLVAVALVWAVVSPGRGDSLKAAGATRLAAAVTLLVGLSSVLAPVIWRNARVGGGFYLTTSQFGPNLFIGNNPAADGTYMALREGRGDPLFERQDATDLAERALGRRLSPSEVSQYWRDRALQFIASEPVQWSRIVGRKLILLLNATEAIDTEAQESHAEWSMVLRITGLIGHFGILLPLAFLGVVLTWGDRSRLWPIHAMALAYAASVIAFFVVARYRYPLVPFLVLYAAAGVARLPDVRRMASRRRQLALVAGTIVIAWFARWPTLSADEMRAITDTNLGVALQAERRLDEAVRRYRRAIEISPGYAIAYNNLGVALRDQGNLEEAIAAYRQAVARRTSYPEAEYNLATALFEDHQPEEAIPHYLAARRAIAPTVAGHNNLGSALAAVGRREEAIVEFRAALTIDPDSIGTRRNLGEALATQGRFAEAIGQFQEIARHEDSPAAHFDLGNVLMATGRVRDAGVEYRAVIRLRPDSARAHSNLGVSLAAQGLIDEAIAEFREALRLEPDFPEAARYLAMALQTRSR